MSMCMFICVVVYFRCLSVCFCLCVCKCVGVVVLCYVSFLFVFVFDMCVCMCLCCFAASESVVGMRGAMLRIKFALCQMHKSIISSVATCTVC